MTFPKNRSTSVRKIHKRTPKGGKAVHYKRVAKSGRHSDPITGQKLQAVSSRQGQPKSSRRPNRKFGGALTSAMSSRVIIVASRVKEGGMKLEEVDLRLLPYVKRLLAKK